MEKIDKRFYLLSSINIIPAFILGGGLTYDTLALLGALLGLVFNHTILVKIVKMLTVDAADKKTSVAELLFLMGLKLVILVSICALVYFYKKELTVKVLAIAFFQLIIQVVSIKTNYQNR